MVKKILAILIVLSVLFSVCGCSDLSGNKETSAPVSEIVVKEHIPSAVVGESYDLSQVIEKEEDVEYSFEAVYSDPESGEEKELVVKRNKITPKVQADIHVKVTAESVQGTASASLVVPISITIDVIDQLIASDGAAGPADEGVVKAVTMESEHFKLADSFSAVQVELSVSNQECNIVDLSHYALMSYYSSRVWDNAAVTVWVFNDAEQDISFCLTGYDPVSMKKFAWDDAAAQVAKAGQWTQLRFSLYQMGIRKVLFNDPNGVREDSLKLSAKYLGSDSCIFYLDGLDIVSAKVFEDLDTGYVKPEPPAGDFSDLLEICVLRSQEPSAALSESDFSNNSYSSYRFGTDESVGYPSFDVDFVSEIDISGFDYISFDVFAEKCYPWVSVAVRYIDENGEIQRHGTSYDFKREQWTTLYLNLDYLDKADLTRVVGLTFSINVADKMVKGAFNCVYFDNVCLYEYEDSQPTMAAPAIEDHDLISGPMVTANIKPGFSGVCKVATDENGEAKSNSTLLFWANNACGYPNVSTTFYFDAEQDWSDYSVLSFDSHQYHGHYWMRFSIITLDEDGHTKNLTWYHDTVLTHWMTNSAPFAWFKADDGTTASSEDLQRVIGLTISVDLAVNVTDEVAHIFFDNVTVS